MRRETERAAESKILVGVPLAESGLEVDCHGTIVDVGNECADTVGNECVDRAR